MKAAADMFLSNMRWRVDNKVDTILNDDDPWDGHLRYLWPSKMHGCDKAGRPVFIDKFGHWKVGPLTKYLTDDGMPSLCSLHRPHNIPSYSSTPPEMR
jgi:hypothetical protein